MEREMLVANQISDVHALDADAEARKRIKKE